jgi:hypothetical protein
VGTWSTIRIAGGAIASAGLAISALAAPAARAAHAASGQPTARITVHHIAVGGVQFQVAIDPVRHLAWAATANGLVRISERTQRVTGRFKVSAEYVTVDPRTATVWGVSPYNGGNPENTVTEVSETTGKVIHQFTTGVLSETPEGIAADPRTGEVWVAAGPGVAEVDEATHRVVAVVNLHTGQRAAPDGVTVDPAAGRVWVAVDPDSGNPTATRAAEISVASRRVVHIFEQGGSPVAIGVDGSRGTAWLVNGNGGTEVVAEATGKVIANHGTPGDADAIALDPRARRAVLADGGNNTVPVLSENTGKVTETASTAFFPQSVAVDPGTGDVYIAIAFSNDLEEFHL